MAKEKTIGEIDARNKLVAAVHARYALAIISEIVAKSDDKDFVRAEGEVAKFIEEIIDSAAYELGKARFERGE